MFNFQNQIKIKTKSHSNKTHKFPSLFELHICSMLWTQRTDNIPTKNIFYHFLQCSCAVIDALLSWWEWWPDSLLNSIYRICSWMWIQEWAEPPQPEYHMHSCCTVRFYLKQRLIHVVVESKCFEVIQQQWVLECRPTVCCRFWAARREHYWYN